MGKNSHSKSRKRARVPLRAKVDVLERARLAGILQKLEASTLVPIKTEVPPSDTVMDVDAVPESRLRVTFNHKLGCSTPVSTKRINKWKRGNKGGRKKKVAANQWKYKK